MLGTLLLLSGAVLVATGKPALAGLPPVLACAIYLLGRLPLRYPLYAFTGIWIASDMLPRPLSLEGGATWKTPLYPINAFLGSNLDSLFGVSLLRFSGTEALIGLMLVIMGVRWLSGSTIDGVGRVAMPRVLQSVLVVAFLTIVGMELRGLASGGDFRQSLWQFRQLLWLPVITLLFARVLRGPRDLAPVGWALTIGTVVKISIGLYYLHYVASPLGLTVDVMTCHEDSVLFVTVLMLWLVACAHAPSTKRVAATMFVCTYVLVGIAANDRRLAYVSLAGSLALFYVLLRGRVRRRITLILLCALPVVALYLVAGRNRSTGIFKPASLILSVVQQKDGSSKTRDIENFNLLQTLKPHQLIGSGWGHEYDEQVKADDISTLFPQYRYIAHNSVLWLWSIGGLVGFTLLWLPLVVSVFLARRGYAFARSSMERTVAITALVVMVCFVNQAWGDMGTQGQTCIILLAWAIAGAGNLAVVTGAFPMDITLWGNRRIGATPTARLQGARGAP